MSKKYLVTGAAGFIGSHLVEELLEKGNFVRVLDYLPLENTRNLDLVKNHQNFEYVQGDIRNKKDIEKFYDKDADALFHLASIVGIKHYLSKPLDLIDISVLGTKNLLEVALKDNMRFIFSSTSEVFGKNPNIPWKETDDRVLGHTSKDRWCYSTSKATCEHMLYGLFHANQFPMSIVRFFNAYGPKQNPIFVVSQSVQRAINGQNPYCYDGGLQTRCFTYVKDIIQGLLKVVESERAIGEDFNLGRPVENTMKEVIELILKKVGNESLSMEDFQTDKRLGETYEDIQRRVPSVEKAKELLNWEATTTLDQGIDEIIQWAKKNPWWTNIKNN